MRDPLQIAIIGMGGFAGAHQDVIKQLEISGACRLVATCDPRMDSFADRQRALDFAGRGVRLFKDYLEMLDACRAELDAVTVPTPVPLHAPMHRACVERGLAVYLEKPPTLDHAELEEMLKVEARAAALTNVGFNYIVEPNRQALKRRLIAGEFGALQKVKVFALWPRSDRYYGRASWSGRLMLDGRLVLDSCMGNAMSHIVHNGLFWAGTRGIFDWGSVLEVAAEMYRAHTIEGADTVFLKATCESGVEFSLAMSHACDGNHKNGERLECERATIEYFLDYHNPRQNYSIRWRDGRVEEGDAREGAFLGLNLREYFKYLKGTTDRPLTRLVDCRPFVHLNDLGYVAAQRIVTIPDEFLDRSTSQADSGRLTAIREIEGIVMRFIDEGKFPSDQGIVWAQPGGKATQEDLPRIVAVAKEMAAARDVTLRVTVN